MLIRDLGCLLNSLIREGWVGGEIHVYDQNEGTTKSIESAEITWKDNTVRVVLTTEVG